MPCGVKLELERETALIHSLSPSPVYLTSTSFLDQKDFSANSGLGIH